MKQGKPSDWLITVLLLLMLLVAGVALAGTGAKKPAKARRNVVARPAAPTATTSAPAHRARTKTHRSARRSAVVSTSTTSAPAPRVSTRAQTPLQALTLTPAEFLILDHGKDKTQFGSHTSTLVSESQFSTLTAVDMAPFKVVYLEPSWGSYSNLTSAMGALTTYVQHGGVAVINIAGNIGNGTGIAPGGGNYSRATVHESETILLSSHPYITGSPYGGATLSTGDFNNWSSTDHGTLSGFPVGTNVVLQNADGPSWIQYRYGVGQVIVTTLTYGWGSNGARGNPIRNIILYALSISAPQLAFTSPSFVNTSPLTLTGTAADTTIKKIKVQVRTDPFVDAVLDTVARTFSLANVSLNPDSNQVVAQGLTANDSLVVADTTFIILDQTPPVVHITFPVNGSEVSSPVTVTGTVTEVYLATVTVNGQTATINGGTFSSSLEPSGGPFPIVAVATDRAGNVGKDSLAVIILSPDLKDAAGFLYDMNTSEGYIDDGGNTTPEIDTDDAYDGWGEFQVNGNTYDNASGTVTFEDNGRELVYPPVPINSLEVSRKVFVPQTGPGFARFINAVHNPTGSPITVDLSFTGNLGSDEDTHLKGTSSGSTTQVRAGIDTWFVTDDNDIGRDDPALAHVFDGVAGDRADSVYFAEGDDEPVISWKNVTVQPGQTLIYLFFEAQRDSTSQALQAAQYLAGLPSALFAGMSSDELRAVQNFKPFGITTPRFVTTTSITITGIALDSTITSVTVNGAAASFDTITRMFSRANVSLNPDSNRVVAQGFTASNSLAAADTIVIILDQTPPVVHITSPAGGDTLSGNVTVQGIAKDKYLDRSFQMHIQVKQASGIVLDSEVVTLPDTTFTTTVELRYSGRTTIVAEARDLAGQTTRDSVTVIVFSPNLVDEKGFLYDIDTSDGELDDGGNVLLGSDDSYDGWNILTVIKNGSSHDYYGIGESNNAQVTYEDNGREIVLPIDSTFAGLHISRKIFVPDQGGRFARYLNIFVNPADTSVTVDIKVGGDFGSDSDTNLRATSSHHESGAFNVNAANDVWFVTDDEDNPDPTESDAALAHVFDGPGGTDKADSVRFQQRDDEPEIFWKQVTIAPHDTVIYMMVESQRTLESEVIGEARFITGLPPVLYQGMSDAERRKLRNFPTNPDSVFGDVTMQGGISALDASFVLRHTAEVLTLSSRQQLVADVSGNGIVGPLDASLILRFVTRQLDTFPVRQLAVPKIIPGTAIAAIQDHDGQPGERVTIPIRLRESANVFGADLVFRYDPAVLEFVEAARTAMTSKYEIAYSQKEGRVHLALAGTAPLGGTGTLAELSFRIIGRDGMRSPLTVERFAVNELEMAGTSAEFVVGKSTKLVPKTFTLSQNYPNPFNPATAISYALPKPVSVRLVLYNVLGQVVRVLVDEPQPTGFYTLMWDGRDGHGRSVASGVYFYRLEAGEFRQTKRLMLLK